MSIRIFCDRCAGGMYKSLDTESAEDVLAGAIAFGWKVQDFGHTCNYCTKILEEIEGDSSTGSIGSIAHALTEGLEKK